MKSLLGLLLLILPLGVVARERAGDSLLVSRSLLPVWKPSVMTGAQLSQTGYTAYVGGLLQWKRLVISAGGKMVLDKTYLFSNAPYGLVTGIQFFPNGNDQRLSGFMSADYQLTFHGNNRSPGERIPGHKVHEYTVGYGFMYSINNRLQLVNYIGFGRYTETMKSVYTGQRVSFSGYNSLLRLGINYTLRP